MSAVYYAGLAVLTGCLLLLAVLFTGAGTTAETTDEALIPPCLIGWDLRCIGANTRVGNVRQHLRVCGPYTIGGARISAQYPAGERCP